MDPETPPPIATFAAITRRVIAKDGFEDFVPTVLYPARREVLVLEGVPADVDLEAVSLEWARRNAIGDEEFLLAFKASGTHFGIIRSHGQALEKRLFTADDQ